MSIDWVGLYTTSIGLSLLLFRYLWRRSRSRCPPSPTSLPFIGNLFSIPPGHEHLAFAKLGEQLKSDIVYLEIVGHKICALNSAEAASDVLDKRSAVYSDRPNIPMVMDPTLMDWSENIAAARYGDLWRSYRRILNHWLNAREVTRFYGQQEQQARLLLQKLLSATNKAQPFEHLKNEIFFTIGSLMLQLAYGYKPRDPKDRFYTEVKLAARNVVEAAMQTNFLVNVFPVLSHVPDWFPGTGWKRIAREWKIQQERAKTEPYEWLKAQVASGTYQPSILSSLLQNHKLLSGLSSLEQDKRLKETGIILFGAGTDTTGTFLINFVFSMVTNPEVQTKAQEELDRVLGCGVLPKVLDQERLPYIRCLIDEVFRLYPPLPLGIPHASYQDDNYRSYDIQKGTAVLGNIWAIGQDARHYENPEVFNPDRFMNPKVQRPPVFGWGRRKCPGAYFAEVSVFIIVASILATFTFSKKRDAEGREIVPQVELERNSLIIELKPFEFELKLRSGDHMQLIIEANPDTE
uniref:Cytochrome P450-9 n=1 Tax=Thanatephorus cucumeris TaxID=107832 RepID=A0A5B8EZ09_THACU|nr:cytochrome P450-9 [Thanatephorus cucumeris]